MSEVLNKNHVETVLKVNGVDPNSEGDVVRSVLISARYSDDEVEAALMVLRDDPVTKETRVDTFHKLYRPDEGFSSQEISDLLGVELDLTELHKLKSDRTDISNVNAFVVWSISIIIATSGILFYMYLYQIGFFHPTVGLAFFNGQ